MNVELTADQKAFAHQAIKAGRLHTEADAVEEALRLWEAREHTRIEILAAIYSAEASLDAGEGRVMDENSTRDPCKNLSIADAPASRHSGPVIVNGVPPRPAGRS